ncbi:putative xylanase/chitin deacetylase [Clostridium sp. BNL1100]|nr:putative xylanase/chitin deacetylase [Clostridium sp. BNL1100]
MGEDKLKKFFGVTIAVLVVIVLVATICVKEAKILNNNNDSSIQTKIENQKETDDDKKEPSQESKENPTVPSDTKKPDDKKPVEPEKVKPEKVKPKQPAPVKIKPMVALTFDDGPHPQYTVQILNSLKKYNGHATFFVVGNRAEKFPAVIKQISQNGNQIGNHTYSHTKLTKLSEAGIKKEIKKTSDILQNIIQKKPSIIRPTYGSVNNRVKSSAGAPLILWSIDTLDWKTKSKTTTVNKVVGKVKDGDIVLMHDLYKPTAQAAEAIIQNLTAKGYKLVTIDELYAARGVKLQSGQVYNNAYKKK